MTTYKKATTEDDLRKVFHIRKTVFVEEQGVALKDEFDQYDTLNEQCEHILVFHQNEPVGTGRLRSVDGFAKLERICLLAPYRKFGLGKVIIQSLEEIAKEKGLAKAKLHGQTHAEGFYQKLGYQTASSIFMEDGIPHVLMIKKFSAN